MRTYARMDGKVVAELVATDGVIAESFHPSLHFVDVSGIEVAVGWRADGNGFVAPPPPEPSMSLPSLSELEARLAALAGQIAALRGQG